MNILTNVYLERGIKLFRENEFALAVADFDVAVALAPDDPYANWNRATALLSLGEYIEGFVAHEWAWRLFSWRGFGPVGEDIERLKILPLWDGTSHQRVLLYHELGFGDAIQCFRYLPTLRGMASSLTLVLDEALARLARQFDIDVLLKVPNDLSYFDCRLPLFSVMRLLRQTVETIPGAPYIKASWQRELCPEIRTEFPTGRIGIAWSGRTQKAFSVERFFASLGTPAHCYALQPGTAPHGVEPLEVTDFADTVHVIERMDHVVTVDTAVAHLAGAMGHPSTHVIIPFLSDWRWWRAEAWYPTIKVYRQPQSGDWNEPFARVRAVTGG